MVFEQTFAILLINYESNKILNLFISYLNDSCFNLKNTYFDKLLV